MNTQHNRSRDDRSYSNEQGERFNQGYRGQGQNQNHGGRDDRFERDPRALSESRFSERDDQSGGRMASDRDRGYGSDRGMERDRGMDRSTSQARFEGRPWSQNQNQGYGSQDRSWSQGAGNQDYQDQERSWRSGNQGYGDRDRQSFASERQSYGERDRSWNQDRNAERDRFAGNQGYGQDRGWNQGERQGYAGPQERYGVPDYGSGAMNRNQGSERYGMDRVSERGDSGYGGRDQDRDRDQGSMQGRGAERYNNSSNYGGAYSDGFRDRQGQGQNMGSSPSHDHLGKGPKGYARSDERVREDVCERLSEGHLDASDIEVTVQNGEVTLSGTVSDRRTKRLAEELVESAIGVKDIENKLKVKAASQTGNGQSHLGHQAQKKTEASAKDGEGSQKTEGHAKDRGETLGTAGTTGVTTRKSASA